MTDQYMNVSKDRNSTLSELANVGLDSLFSASSYDYHSRNHHRGRLPTLLRMPELNSYFDTKTSESFMSFVAEVRTGEANNNDRLDDPKSLVDSSNESYWVDRFKSISELSEIKLAANSLLRGSRSDIEYGISIRDDLSSFSIFKILHDKVMSLSLSYTPLIYRRAIDDCAKKDSLSFKIFLDGKLFCANKHGLNHEIRARLYRGYTIGGLLSVKTARKIRSDSSYNASLAGLSALLESKDLYPDTWEDMLLQFTDSTHEDVLVRLAEKLPIELVSSLMGCDSSYAKRIMESRMERVA